MALKEERSKERWGARQGRDCSPPLFLLSSPLPSLNFLIVVSTCLHPTSPFHHGGGDVGGGGRDEDRRPHPAPSPDIFIIVVVVIVIVKEGGGGGGVGGCDKDRLFSRIRRSLSSPPLSGSGCGDAIFCESREEGGGWRRERASLEGKRRVGVFFFSPFLWLSTVFLFFGVEMQVEKPCQLVSTCFFIFLQIKKSLPSSNLAAKFALGRRYWRN